MRAPSPANTQTFCCDQLGFVTNRLVYHLLSPPFYILVKVQIVNERELSLPVLQIVHGNQFSFQSLIWIFSLHCQWSLICHRVENCQRRSQFAFLFFCRQKFYRLGLIGHWFIAISFCIRTVVS